MKMLCALLGAVLLLPAPATSAAQSAESDSARSDSARFSLTITSKQNTFKSGEIILLNLVVKNTSDQEYCENHFLETGNAEWNGYEVEVRGMNGVALPLMPKPRLRGMRSRGKLCIKPGETLKESLSVDQLVDLKAPGVYQIQVDHVDRGANTHVQSNIIHVTVTP